MFVVSPNKVSAKPAQDRIGGRVDMGTLSLPSIQPHLKAGAPEYAAQFFRSELAKYAKLVKKAGFELQ